MGVDDGRVDEEDYDMINKNEDTEDSTDEFNQENSFITMMCTLHSDLCEPRLLACLFNLFK